MLPGLSSVRTASPYLLHPLDADRRGQQYPVLINYSVAPYENKYDNTEIRKYGTCEAYPVLVPSGLQVGPPTWKYRYLFFRTAQYFRVRPSITERPYCFE